MANLLKTFVNAAVSQVGRDGGRVISNKIYGDGHAMPVRITGRKSIQMDDGREIEVHKDKEDFLSSPWYMYFFIFIGTMVLFPIVWIYFLLQFFKYQRKNTTEVTIRNRESVYKPDGRTRSGTRNIGFRYVFEKIPTPATESEIKMYKMKSWLHFALFLIYLGFAIWFFFLS